MIAEYWRVWSVTRTPRLLCWQSVILLSLYFEIVLFLISLYTLSSTYTTSLLFVDHLIFLFRFSISLLAVNKKGLLFVGLLLFCGFAALLLFLLPLSYSRCLKVQSLLGFGGFEEIQRSVSPCLPGALSSYGSEKDMKISRRRGRQREIQKEILCIVHSSGQ